MVFFQIDSYLNLLMNDIYNFIKINSNNNDTLSIYITELDDYMKNKNILYLGNKFYNYLLENIIKIYFINYEDFTNNWS